METHFYRFPSSSPTTRLASDTAAHPFRPPQTIAMPQKGRRKRHERQKSTPAWIQREQTRIEAPSAAIVDSDVCLDGSDGVLSDVARDYVRNMLAVGEGRGGESGESDGFVNIDEGGFMQEDVVELGDVGDVACGVEYAGLRGEMGYMVDECAYVIRAGAYSDPSDEEVVQRGNPGRDRHVREVRTACWETWRTLRGKIPMYHCRPLDARGRLVVHRIAAWIGAKSSSVGKGKGRKTVVTATGFEDFERSDDLFGDFLEDVLDEVFPRRGAPVKNGDAKKYRKRKQKRLNGSGKVSLLPPEARTLLGQIFEDGQLLREARVDYVEGAAGSRNVVGKRKGARPSASGGKGKGGGADGAMHAKPIGESNRGYAMLAKMGWAPGDGLGADGEGRKEPIRVSMRPGRTGLGL